MIILGVYVAIIISFIVMFRKMYKLYISSKDVLVKTLYIIGAIAMCFPFILFLLDTYNIPSSSEYTNNINVETWLNFIGTYFSSIFSAIISAAFLVFITREQIEETHKDNIAINKENQRIQNLPFLQYDFSNKIDDAADLKNTEYILVDKNSEYDSVEFSLNIKNIGLNSVRKLYILIDSDLFKETLITKLNGQDCIEKNGVRKKEFIINSLDKGNYKLYIIIYYQDLMSNWYEQKINFDIEVTNIHNPERYTNINFKVFDEIKIETLPQKLTEYIAKNN